MDEESTIWWYPLCGNATPYQAFWHDEVMVDTSRPDMTDCFRDTVAVWICYGLLLVSSPLYCLYLARQPTKYYTGRPRGWLYWIKIVLLVCLTVFRLLTLGCAIHDVIHDPYNPSTPASVLAVCLKLLATVVTVFIVHKQFRKQIHTSGYLTMTYFLLLLVEGATIWSFGHRWSEMMTRGLSVWRLVDGVVGCVVTTVLWFLILLADQAVIDNRNNMYPDTETISLLTHESHQYKTGQRVVDSPEMKYSFMSDLLSLWHYRFIWKCMRRGIQLTDIPELCPEYSSTALMNQFDRVWSSSPRPWLLGVLVRCMWPRLALAVCIRITAYMLLVVQVMVLRYLLLYVESGDAYRWKGVMYAIALLLCGATASTMLMWASFHMTLVGMLTRSMLTGAVFRKFVRLSSVARQQTTIGQIVNFISVDGQRIQDTVVMLQPLATIPTATIAVTALLWPQLHAVTIIILVLVVFIMIPGNGLGMGAIIQKFQHLQMKEKDGRIKLLNEMMSGIKIIKLYAWEGSFVRRLTGIRQSELTQLRISNLLFAVSSVLWNLMTNVVLLITYTTHLMVNMGSMLTPDLAFVTSSSLQVLTTPTFFFNSGTSYMAQSLAALDRISKFLMMEEENKVEELSTSIAYNSEKDYDDHKSNAIQISEGYFSWLPDTEIILHGLDLMVPRGSLVAIVGHVGSGKSSMIASILGGTTTRGGHSYVKGSTALVPQTAWIQNATLRKNILMNKSYRSEFYHRVIKACALTADLEMLVNGDMTEIGQKGMTLSGGQKQRVSLARAVYQDRDIYLLDDPLSAVDAHVAKHLYDKVLGPKGLLSDKTRILVTNNMSYLSDADSIIMLERGHIRERGTYAQLAATSGAFTAFIRGDTTQDTGNDSSEIPHLPTVVSRRRSSKHTTGSVHSHKAKSYKSVTSHTSTEDHELLDLTTLDLPHHDVMNMSKLKTLFSSSPWWLLLVICTCYLMYTVTLVLGNIQLSVWTSLPYRNNQLNMSYTMVQGEYDRYNNDVAVSKQQRVELLKYAAIIISQLLSNLAGSLCMVLAFIRASRVLHSSLLSRVVNAPMSFFDTTPVGKIVNRLSRDIDILDFNVPGQVRMWIMYSLPLAAIFVSVVYTDVYFLIVLVPVLIIFSLLVYTNLCGVHKLRHIESTRLSPLLVHVDDVVSGISSIRAYKLTDWFIDVCDDLVDTLQRPVYMSCVVRRASALHVQYLGALVVLTTTLMSLGGSTGPDSGHAGMAISVSMMTFSTMGAIMLSITELNSYLVSVERIEEYTHIEQEASPMTCSKLVPSDWPSQGQIQFQDYSARYRVGLDLALKHLDLNIKAGQKVAVVGRTGAGKSSLSLALFRIFEAATGGIIIDDVDISRISLSQLRSKISIIPQDPVIFAGSLRDNLDPHQEYNDSEIWTALDQAHLGDFISALPHQLNFDCGGADSLSLGQCQLLCLARALLRRSRVLILDEATAAVDPETDSLIQTTIRSALWHYTILTIAHRLSTILDYDRVGVMESGRLVEFDDPRRLLHDSSSLFHGMAATANIHIQENPS